MTSAGWVCFILKYELEACILCVNLQIRFMKVTGKDNEPFFSLYIGKWSIGTHAFYVDLHLNRVSDITLRETLGRLD